MTRDQYLAELRALLQGIPDEERQELLAEYQAHFERGYEEGKTDEDVIRSLGSPQSLAKQVAGSHTIERAQTKRSIPHIIRVVVATISLGLFNLIFVLGPFIGLLAFLFAICVVDLSLLIAPTISLAGQLIQGPDFSNFVQSLFTALALTSAGALLAIGLMYLIKWLYRLVVLYLRFNLQIIQGKGERA